MIDVQMPPVEFDYNPPTKPWVIYVKNPDGYCRKLGGSSRPGWIIRACQTRTKSGELDQCVIILPEYSSKTLRDKLYRHERGHCNGWKHK